MSVAGGLRRVLGALDVVTYWMAIAAGAVFLLASIFITLDVVGRKFFHTSSGVTDEMGGYALVFGSMWALAWTLRTSGHVRIDVVLPYLPRAIRMTLDYLAMAAMILFATVMAYYAATLAYDSFATDARAMSFLRTPVFAPQAFLAFGLALLAVEGAVILLLGIGESIGAGRLVELSVGHDEEIVVPAASDTPLV